MASNRKSQTNLSGWLSSILSSPAHQASPKEEAGGGDRELKNISDEDWCVIEDSEMDGVTNGDGTPTTRKKSVGSKSSLLSSPSLGTRSSSVSGKATKSTGSPSSLHRSSSSRGRKPNTLEVTPNGRSNGRSASPGRSISGPGKSSGLGRSSSPNRSPLPKKSSMSSSRSTSSPVPGQSHAQQNGTKSTTEMDESSLGSKIRDTLRISRPKKKKGTKGKGLAYSITPVEINMNASSKYQDPFETSFADSSDGKSGEDHDFKPASTPHNKPECCDVCGVTSSGLYRQVLKCSSKWWYTHILYSYKVYSHSPDPRK